MRRLAFVFFLLLTTACAHSAQEEARWNAAADKQEELARALERLAQKQDALEGKVTELASSVSGLKHAGLDPNHRPSSPDPAVLYKITIGDGAVRGPAGAKITIVEWADFQCPFCARVVGTLHELDKDYPGEIRFVYKHLPLGFHQNAKSAAKAAEAAAQQGQFWPMWEVLFENNSNLYPEQLEKFANGLQLNMDKFRAATLDPAVAARIDAQAAEAARFGVTGTPSFFINGHYIAGAQPLDSFKAIIDRELVRADKLLASGVRREELYDRLIADGQTGIGAH